MVEELEARLLLVIAGTRPGPDLLDEAILLRLPLAADTTTHYYFDRNGSASGSLAWNGTSQSYNGHTGTDYSGGPRSKPVYAAAGGILVAKVDGHGDFEGTANGNYVKLNHGNDRNGTPINTWYLHLNAGTVTSKPLGSYIAPGEQVGGVGTSGNSTGLHLHLHLAYGSAAFDPYAASGEVSWWANQGGGSPSAATPPKKFDVGDHVEVFALSGSATLTVRSPNPTSGSIGAKPNGATAEVLSGPVLSYISSYNTDVYNRYLVRFTDGMEGWVAQNWLREDTETQEIQITHNGVVIPDGSTSAIDFGSVERRQTGPTRIFVVRNVGFEPLSLGALSAPPGFSIVEGLGAYIQPGSFDTFTIRLDSDAVGTKTGQISLVNDDADENPYNFSITGTVTSDVTGPTADVIDVSPDPFVGPLASMTIVFSEAVVGFDKDDLTFTRNEGSIDLAAATLTTSDSITFTLGSLSSLTEASGTYELTVGGTIADDSANALQSAASEIVKVQTSLLRGDAPGVMGDAYYLRRSEDGTHVEIFENVAPVGEATYSLPWAGLASLAFDMGGGNNTLTIDYNHGDPLQAGAGALSYLAGGGNNALNLVGAGTFTFFDDAGATAENLSVNANATDIVFDASQHLAALTIDGATATMPASGKVLTTESLVIVNDGGLDVGANAVIIHYSEDSPIGQWIGSEYDGVTGLLAIGHNGGTWSGPDGIHTTAATPAGRYTLGVGEASQVLGLSDGASSMWHEQSVDATSVLIKFTYSGDIDLNGILDGDDYFRIDSHVAQSGIVFGYGVGDINFDGGIDGDDYFRLDSNISDEDPPL